MKTKNILAVALLTAATGAAFAQSGLDRAQVRNDVLAARAAGQLVPAGEGSLALYDNATSQPSRSIADVRAEVAQARRTGQLVPAGQGPIENRPAVASDTTRLAVKRDVLRARADGDLIPAGEGVGTPLYAERRVDDRPATLAMSPARRRY